MKRRLNLAMGLMHDPQVIFLDEPSPGLDPQTRLLLWDFISSIPDDGKRTVVLTTHYMEEADRLSTRVGIMDHGRILVEDRPEELKKSMGEGDLLEMEVSGAVKNFIRKLHGIEGITSVDRRGNMIYITGHDIVSLLPPIVMTAKDMGMKISGMRIKQTTLEDVFIHLTGRHLRERRLIYETTSHTGSGITTESGYGQGQNGTLLLFHVPSNIHVHLRHSILHGFLRYTCIQDCNCELRHRHNGSI